MRFVLFVEGDTENKAVPAFLKRWLDEQLNQRVGIQPVRFDGWSDLWHHAPARTRDYFDSPQRGGEIIAVIALLDLHGLDFPSESGTLPERYDWAKAELERAVNHPRFHAHFAVHETEAWLLSDKSILPARGTHRLLRRATHPERINFNEPPARLLDRLFRAEANRGYKKTVDGKNLFQKLNPSTAYQKCPHLRILLDQMQRLAQDAGLN
jgi:hypothetical protein